MSERKRVGVVLAGCGARDGSEIHEAVLTLLALDLRGAEAVCMAPTRDQAQVVDHLTGEPVDGRRSQIVEAARIARGKVRPLGEVRAGELDALILPGGSGTARNLTSFAVDGADCTIDEDLDRLLGEVHAQGKPIGAICISPTTVARHFRGSGERVTVTVGTCPETAARVEAMGARHEDHAVDEVAVDREHRVVSTPAYMLARSIGEVWAGVEELVDEVLAMA